MDRQFIHAIIIATLLLLAGPRQLLAENPGTVKVRVSDWAPAFWQADGKWVGMDMDFYRALEKATGLTFIYVNLPWSRGIVSLENGTCTLMSQLSRTPQRKGFMHFFGPYNHEEMVLVVNKSDAALPTGNLDDLIRISRKRRLKIGIEKDAWYGAAFKQKMAVDPDIRKHFSYARTTLAKMLIYKRLLGFFEQRVVISHQIRNQSEYRDLAIHPFTINSAGIYFGVSKKADPDVITKIRQSVQRLTADGTFKAIEARWKRQPHHQ